MDYFLCVLQCLFLNLGLELLLTNVSVLNSLTHSTEKVDDFTEMLDSFREKVTLHYSKPTF